MKRIAPIPLNVWREQIGRTASTVWVWRRKGWLQTINISGKIYVTPEAAEEFMRRAEAGEFSQVAIVPRRAKEDVA